MFTPTLDWGSELWASLCVDRQGLGDRAVGHPDRPGPDRPLHHWGRQFWQDHRRLLHRPAACIGLDLVGRAAAVGDHRRPTRRCCSATTATTCSTSFQVVAAGRRRGDDAVKKSGKRRLLVLDRRLLQCLATIYVAQDHAGSVPDAAVHAALARLADRPAHRRLARRQGLLPRPLHRRHDRQPRSAHPGRHRHLHHRCRAAAQHAEHRPARSTLLFGAIDAIASMISFTAILWNLSGPLTLPIVGCDAAQGACSGSDWSTSSFATVIAFWIGRPIIWLTFDNEKFNAAFRYALVRLRDAAEAVAFYRGEIAERIGAAAALRARRRQLQALHQPDDRLLRLEPVDQPDHRAAALRAAVPAVLRRRDQARRHDPVRVGVRQHPGRAVVLPQRLRPVRRLPRGDHPSARSRHRQRGGAGRCPRSRRRPVRTAPSSFRPSRSARRTARS